MNFKVQAEHLSGVGFNNVPHLHNFLNYLFRTDAKQKWTVESTEHNYLCLLDEEGNIQLFSFGNLESRKEMKKNAYAFLMPLMRSNQEDQLLNDILYFDAVDPSNNEELTNELSQNEVEEIIRFLISQSNKNKEETFYVVHLDQDDSAFHIHSVYFDNDNSEECW